MEAIADRVIGLLASLASKELELICNFQDDLESMKSMVIRIKAILLDAEKKAMKCHQINDWLEKLKDVLLDTEDLLDAYLADELSREVKIKDKMAKEVCIFFSKNNRIVCATKMGHKIKAIKKKLDVIFNEKNNLHLSEISSNASIEFYNWRLTHSLVSEENVVGRESERMHLVGMLLNSPNAKNNVSVIAIVGIGGLGKTTLAQLAYNDKAIKKHFELMKWVCVFDEFSEFSIKRIAQNIIGQQYDELEQAAQGLRKMLEGKRFLLVLDNVWNEDPKKWLELESLLRGGKKGSMIIVTTRNEKVAQIIDPLALINLQDLDFEKSWELFHRVAFQDGKEPANQELVGIGKDIVRKCAGVPLAIRTIGSLLFTKKLEVSEWSYFRDNELVNIDFEDNKIFFILKLSYHHLPSYLKNCFAFCSLFPKDHDFERNTLIQLWIAEGFIQPLDKNGCLEDVGDEYFRQLLSRCLFQDVRLDDFGDIKWCKMHDLIHDLAQSIFKNECYIVTSERIKEENFGDGIRHMSSHFDHGWKFPLGNVKTKKVRTILSPKGWLGFISSDFASRFFNPTCESTTTLPKHLRVLDLSKQQLEIPESIGDLKHLRYLDLSWNYKLTKLPRGITKLHNLLTLRLNNCGDLIELPRDIKRLVRLRHLELDNCDELICMPCGLGCLTNLRTLTTFVVDKERSSTGARISELHDLTRLRGGLNITRLERQRSNMKEVESTKFLLHMPYLRELVLVWSSFSLEEFKEGDEHKDEIILEALEPPHTIKALVIEGFYGKWLLKWIGSLMSLQELRLHRCTSLASLPKFIGSLTSLQILSLNNCYALALLPQSIGSLTSLQKLSLNSCSTLASLPESIGSLTSLQRLSLNSCSTLTSLPESIGSFTLLQTLSLNSCFALASLPESIGSLTSLQSLGLNSCFALTSLPESIRSLTSLQTLGLNSCSALATLPKSIGSLTSLQELGLSSCSALASLPESVGSLTSLQTLVLNNCFALASLPESIGNLTSLQELGLNNCSALASLPESIGRFTSLQMLSLNKCSTLASLPESIGSLTSLQALGLNNCSALASLPESIGSLTLLQELGLNNCSALTSLPKSIGSLISLQTLGLNSCSAFPSLPESIGSLTSLQELGLNNCSALASLPESIGSFTSLQILSLNKCSALVALPKSIESLTSLQRLSLNNCSALASLPESIGSLTSLQTLGLNKCSALASLPESTRILTSLQMLYLNSCSALTSLPESIGSLTSLQRLGLNSCSSLTSLPKSFGSLTSLQRLYLDNCSALASLPESIGSLTSLQILYLNNCSALVSLPKSIGKLTSLQMMYLNNCSALALLPESIGSLTSLQELSLNKCFALASLPDTITSLTSLQRLHIIDCFNLKKRYGQQLQGFNWLGLVHIPDIDIH